MRLSFNGRTSVSHTEDASSILASRSKHSNVPVDRYRATLAGLNSVERAVFVEPD